MSGALSIRQVDSAHPALKALHTLALPLDKHPAYEDGRWWVARLDGEPVAFAGLQPSVNWSDTQYMVRCGVLPAARGQGIQKRLIRARIAAAKRLGARWVISDTFNNPASANSLISCGFRLYEPSIRWGADGTLYWRLPVNQDTE